MRPSNLILTILITFLSLSHSFGQKIITGKVTNEFGEPIANATIGFIGSREYGTMTQKDGTYRTFIPKNSDSIKCRHLSYFKKIIKIDGNNLINFIIIKHEPISTNVSFSGTHKYTQEEISKSTEPEIYVEDDKIFTTIEIDAEFTGGTNALKIYFENQLFILTLPIFLT